MSVATTKTALLREMLCRTEGASLKEICAITDWQPHSARAVISGLRKAGAPVCLEPRATPGADRRYRIIGSATIAPIFATVPEPATTPRRRRAGKGPTSSPDNASQSAANGSADIPASEPERDDG